MLPELTRALIDQRIATLREEGTADSEEPLRSYRAAESWLASTQLHKSDAARYIGELTEAPRREAKIQARLDATEPGQEVDESLATLSVQELEAELLLNQTEKRDARETRDILDRQLAARESRADSIRERLDAIAIRLEAMPSYGGVVDPAAEPSISEASQWLVRAEQESLREERLALLAQLDSQPVRYSAMTLERAELQTHIDELVQRTKQLTERLRDELTNTAAQDSLNLAKDSPIYPLAHDYQAENAVLGERRLELELSFAKFNSERQTVARTTRRLNDRFARARRVVEFAHESEVLLELLLSRRELLRSIISIESDVIDTLSELQTNYEEHKATIAEYRRFLDPLVLWLPSGSRLWKTDFSQIPGEIAVLVKAWTGIEAAIQPRFLGFMSLALILLLLHTRLREYQHRQNEPISRPREASIHFTALALVATALRALPPALMVAAAASLFSEDKDILSVALNSVLFSVAAWLFTAKLLSILCEQDGVALKHFQWNEQLCDRLRIETKWFLRWLLPGLALAAVLYRLYDTAPLLGRMAMLVITLWVALHIARARAGS